ncbi:outer membrane protein assembly factor BamD [Litoribacillus peritrichatus]|uniref:Outer membrane protein assembly factor BamD n=1 Tax=Litoribacillus peritrichatus TaxID=718191 RepID=A0ABP7NCA2_9GAMM
MMLKRFSFIIVLFALLAGCSSDDKKPDEPEKTELEYYSDAQELMDTEQHFQAIKELSDLENYYPFGRYAEQAKLELMFNYIRLDDYTNAHATAERFLRLHPRHPKVDYAYYVRALSTYYMTRGFFDSFISIDRAERDMGIIEDAFTEFSEFLSKYPKSQYAVDARQRMLHLRDYLANHEIYAARYLIRRQAFAAAANRGKYIVTRFQGTTAVPEGLAIMVESYQKLGLDDLANDSLSVLVANYPDYKDLDENGQLNIKDVHSNDQRSFLNILTFGLLG